MFHRVQMVVGAGSVVVRCVVDGGRVKNNFGLRGDEEGVSEADGAANDELALDGFRALCTW